jgi:hypothetical protein
VSLIILFSGFDDGGLILRNFLDISLPYVASSGMVLPALFITAVGRGRGERSRTPTSPM